MTEKRTVRCSQLPILDKCKGLLKASEQDIIIKTSGQPASIGIAVHSAVAERISPDPARSDVRSLDAHCKKHGVNPASYEEVQMLVNSFMKLWHEGNVNMENRKPISRHFPDPQIEQYLEHVHSGVKLTGSPDMYSLVKYVLEALSVGDLKTGYKDSDFFAQLLGYAYLIIMYFAKNGIDFKGDAKIHLWVFWIRDMDWEIKTFTAREVIAWGDKLLTDVDEWDGRTFESGEHCEYCPMRWTCPAKRQMAQSHLQLIEGVRTLDRKTIAKNGVDIWRKSKMVKKDLTAIEDLIKELAKEGKVPAFDGQVLKFYDTEKLDTALAIDVLSKDFTDGEILEQVTITKKAVKALTKSKLPEKPAKGEIGEANEIMDNKLRKAEALYAGSQTIKLVRE